MTTTQELHDDLRTVMNAARIESPTAYTIAGGSRELPQDIPEDGREAALTAAVEAGVYESLYVRPQRSGAEHSYISAHRDFVGLLSRANTGVGSWESGWRIMHEPEDGLVQVRKDGASFWASPDELRTPTGRVIRGESCDVRVGKELRRLVPGFYVAIGDGEPEAASEDHADPLFRFYWNLTADIAIRYVASTTRLFNDARIPFKTKVLSDPSGYVRADGGVLYIERRHLARARPLVERIREQIATGLRDDVPMFVQRLAPGVGFAEDPGDGRSFGQSRSALAARALLRCYADGVADVDSRAAVLADEFRCVGLLPARPWLSHK